MFDTQWLIYLLFSLWKLCVLGFLFMSTNAGDLHLAFDVVLRASNAKYGSSEQSLAFFNAFFTVYTVLSASPLV